MYDLCDDQAVCLWSNYLNHLVMNTKSIERQAGFYKIINAEKQIIGGNDTGMYWITDTSRVLVSEDEYLEHLKMQH